MEEKGCMFTSNPRKRYYAMTRFVFSIIAIVISAFPLATSIRASEVSADAVHVKPKEGFIFNKDAGLQYVKGDFKWTTWAYAERAFTDETDYWRRVRQGMEFDFPRFSSEISGSQYRPVFVYEVDFTDTDFFRASERYSIWENLYVALQDAEDPSKFRFVFGENTHILSREDNLSSGNLTTINRSLILEELGTARNFGTQFGAQLQTAITSKTLLQVSLQDNRGSLNTDEPRYNVLNDFAARVNYALTDNAQTTRKLDFGFAIDYTRDVGERDFTLLSAINQTPLGSLRAAGGKFTMDVNADFESILFGRPCLLEFETIYSHYADSGLDAVGGYVQGQYSIFDSKRLGELVPFARYDLSHISADGRVTQQAIRTGINFNLPFTWKRVNLHLEYAKNILSGPDRILTSGDRDCDEFAIMLRISTTPYTRF